MVDFNFISYIENKTYKVSEDDMLKAEHRMDISLPNDLKQLYFEVGCGFIKGSSVNAINRILGPGAVADIRLQEGIFEFDPDIDELYDNKNKLIFFEVNEGVYISLDLQLENNPVFYFDIQIAESLKDFFKRFINDNEYFIDLIME